MNCLSVFDHFVRLALKGLKLLELHCAFVHLAVYWSAGTQFFLPNMYLIA